MTDKNEALDVLDMDAAPVPGEDEAGPDAALKIPAEQDPDEDTAWMKGLAPEVTRRIQHILEMESQPDKLEKKLIEGKKTLEDQYKVSLKSLVDSYKASLKTLEDDYKISLESLYTKRYKIVNGEVDVESNTYETGGKATSDEKATKVKGIPYFWLTAMKNNEELAKKITRRDEEALKHLIEIKCCTSDVPLKLKLDFLFDANPFFENSILTRTYKNIEMNHRITDAESTGTKIKWHQKKRLTSGKRNSFFDFFGDDEEDFGHILKTMIIPNAALWYIGKASQEDQYKSASSEEDSSEEEERKLRNSKRQIERKLKRRHGVR